MWDFQPIIDIWKAYAGTGSLLVLFLLSLFYIWKKEERKDIRNLMVWGTVLIAAGFSCPLFRKIFVRLLDSETYYRVLWVLPIGVAIAYAGMLLLREDKDSAVEEVTGDKSGEAALSGDKEKTIPFRRKRRPWVQPVGLVVLAAVGYTKAPIFPRRKTPTIFPRWWWKSVMKFCRRKRARMKMARSWQFFLRN